MDFEARPGDQRIALIAGESDAVVTYGALAEQAQLLQSVLPENSLVVVECRNDLATYQLVGSLLLAGIAALLVEGGSELSETPEIARHFGASAIYSSVADYHATEIDFPGQTDIPGLAISRDSGTEVHPDLALMITTSGSTGTRKYVRLSTDNVQSNAHAIARSLNLQSTDRPITTLPLSYSFGMSILTSHLVVGAALIVSKRSVLEREFWELCRRHSVSSLSGVPSLYSALARLDLETLAPDSLLTFTQAGGKLDSKYVEKFTDFMDSKSGRFFVMYGQTEASPRISSFDVVEHRDKIGSVGLPLEGGVITMEPLGDSDQSELLYSGPNVMMGYAQKPSDLALGITFDRPLRTGDLGYLDEDGFIFISGRLKRIAKLAGIRTSLDEVESLVQNLDNCVAVSFTDDKLVILTTTEDAGVIAAERRRLCSLLKVPPKVVKIQSIDSIPLLDSGKPDHIAIKRIVEMES